ncbi:MAG: hypothetical protein A3F11_08530 [Gammaproteobacteria bacterium RIFCSPHIGHO2_12_FULL_37_14]|nr:MAG: hypothetical protein A3F11_08530 [Gammaproteobacteria bacterium RIFCSPHIGHO2_12_FULL_37_14]
MLKYTILCLMMILLSFTKSFAEDNEGLGQTIQIYTRLHTFVGKPSWLLIIRDVDTNQNIPYLFDLKRGTNFWVAFTYSRNYLITVSELQFSPYRRDPYTVKKIKNFCQLESWGHIVRGKSYYVTISGNLTPNADTYTCHVSKYTDANFTIVTPESMD